eukprot:Skav217977  [mRNA]  locus=scaffold496:153919:160337:- [translate_table: standard]
MSVHDIPMGLAVEVLGGPWRSLDPVRSGERRFSRGGVGANSLYNSLVFKKVQNLMGGRLKATVTDHFALSQEIVSPVVTPPPNVDVWGLTCTAEAPLSAEIQKFIQTVLNVPVRQGYGLTETCAGSVIQPWSDNTTGSVGVPTCCTVLRLADWPEGGYSNSDKDKPEIGMRRGEVLIGGTSVSQGYFVSEHAPSEELKKKNEERFGPSPGSRDLWKGPNGEYVALTKVEAVARSRRVVAVKR